MSFDANVMSYFQELQLLKSLSEEESKSFLDLLVLAVLADEQVTEDELVQLDDELMRLPFLWDADSRDRIVEHSATTREYLESVLSDEDALDEFVIKIADNITDPDHRVVALRMFIAVIVSDGLADLERERVFDVGRAFGFESENIATILEDVSTAIA